MIGFLGQKYLANKYSCKVLEKECIGEWGGKHETLVYECLIGIVDDFVGDPVRILRDMIK